MGLFSRIGDLFRMLFSFFLEGAEDRVPLERRLAYDRVKRAENLKGQMGAAEDVGAAAEMMVQQLAEARIVAAYLRQEAKAHLEAASSAAHRSDTTTQQQEEERASALAEELAMAETEVNDLESLVEEALSDKQEAIAMVLDQSKELERLSRSDSRMVAKTRMTSMRRQQLELREQMMELVPSDQGNLRARMKDKVVQDEAKFRARRDVVDALWKQKRRTGADAARVTTAVGAATLAELKREMGYDTTSEEPPAQEAAPARVAAAESPAAEEQMTSGGES